MVLALNPEILAMSDVELAVVIEDRSKGATSRLDAIRAIQTKPTELGLRALTGVLADEAEPVPLRVAATLALSRFNPDLAEPPLRDAALRSQEPRIVRNALRSLGRIGGPASIDTALEVEEIAEGMLVAQAHYAAILIAYRHRLSRPNLKPPSDGLRTLPLDLATAVHVEVRRLSKTEGALAIAQVMEDPIVLNLDPSAVFEDDCGGSLRLIAFDRAFIGQDGAAVLARAPAVLGVIGTWNAAGKKFSSGETLLATPDHDGTGRLNAHDGRGEPMYLGRYDGSSFEIAAVDRPGAIPMEMAGRYENGELVLETGVTAVQSQRSRQPAPFIERS